MTREVSERLSRRTADVGYHTDKRRESSTNKAQQSANTTQTAGKNIQNGGKHTTNVDGFRNAIADVSNAVNELFNTFPDGLQPIDDGRKLVFGNRKYLASEIPHGLRCILDRGEHLDHRVMQFLGLLFGKLKALYQIVNPFGELEQLLSGNRREYVPERLFDRIDDGKQRI